MSDQFSTHILEEWGNKTVKLKDIIGVKAKDLAERAFFLLYKTHCFE